MTNIDNDKLLQFVSKEICYQPESFKQFTKDKKYYLQKQSFLFGARGDHKFRDDQYDFTGWGDNGSQYDYGPLVGYNKRTSFKFIIPCISNCAVELFTGPGDNGDGRGEFYVNNLTINNGLSKDSTICYLDTPLIQVISIKLILSLTKIKELIILILYITLRLQLVDLETIDRIRMHQQKIAF